MPERNLSRSRRLKTEHKRLIKQTVYAGLGAVVLLLLFLFLILPNASRIFGIFFPGSGDGTVADTLPPPAPVFFASSSATSSATIKLQIQAEVDSQVTAYANLQEVGQVVVGSEGVGEIELKLQEGENIITMQASDPAGNVSVVSKSQTIFLDTQVPKIELTTPTDGQTIVGKTKQNLTIEGKTEPGAKVFLNDRFVFAKADGGFIHTLSMTEGANILKLRAVDKAGNTSELSLTVTFTP